MRSHCDKKSSYRGQADVHPASTSLSQKHLERKRENIHSHIFRDYKLKFEIVLFIKLDVVMVPVTFFKFVNFRSFRSIIATQNCSSNCEYSNVTHISPNCAPLWMDNSNIDQQIKINNNNIYLSPISNVYKDTSSVDLYRKNLFNKKFSKNITYNILTKT